MVQIQELPAVLEFVQTLPAEVMQHTACAIIVTDPDV